MINTLKNVDIIYAEDTRISKKLLNHFSINKPLHAYHKFSEKSQLSHIKIHLAEGKSLALLSDAGTPNLSDPGAISVAELHKEGFPVSPIPGPSALTSLISASGILCNSFYFIGFLPKKEQEKKVIFNNCPKNSPIIFFETAKRLLKTLTLFENDLPIKTICLGKELSKTFETIIEGNLDHALEKLSATPIKGEWIVIIELDFKQIDNKKENEIISELKALDFSSKQIKILSKLLSIPNNRLKKELLI